MIAWLLAGLAVAAEPPSPALLAAIDTLQGELAEVRGLSQPLAVEVAFEDEADVRAGIVEDLLDPEVLEDLAEVTHLLLVLRLADDDLDLRTALVDAMSAQVGGYYDPDLRRLVLVQRGEAFAGGVFGREGEDRLVTAHELVHALTDQHFDLWALTHRDWRSSDVELALGALVEGDATLTMFEVGARAEGGSFRAIPPARFQRLMDEADDTPGGMGSLPPFLANQILFPYVHGVAWAHAVWTELDWDGLDRAYTEAPPMSSEHILHPDRWLHHHDPPRLPALPGDGLSLGAGWRLAADDVLGEAGIRSLLAAHLPERPRPVRHRAAAGWGGDRLQVHAHEDGRRAAVWHTVWDTTDDAADAAAMLSDWVDVHAPTRRRGPPHRSRWRGQTTWAVQRSGTTVVVGIDLPRARAEALMRAAEAVPAPAIAHLDAIAPARPEPRTADTPEAPAQDDAAPTP